MRKGLDLDAIPASLRPALEEKLARLASATALDDMDAAVASLLPHVWIGSEFVAETCLRHPDWLGWLASPLARVGTGPRPLCHLFTERPIYRPEDTVEVKGYLRLLDKGLLRLPAEAKGTLTLKGPDEGETALPLGLTAEGSFHLQLPGGRAATGDYALSAAWKAEGAEITCTVRPSGRCQGSLSRGVLIV